MNDTSAIVVFILMFAGIFMMLMALYSETGFEQCINHTDRSIEQCMEAYK